MTTVGKILVAALGLRDFIGLVDSRSLDAIVIGFRYYSKPGDAQPFGARYPSRRGVALIIDPGPSC